MNDLIQKLKSICGPGAPGPFTERCFYPRGWGKQEVGFFNRESKAYLFRSMMAFFSTSPAPGDYFEFGCHKAYTMRMAWDHTKVLAPQMAYFAFDSFQGFPEVTGIDEGHWKKGDLATSESEFRAVCAKHGMPESRLHTIAGFFSETLKAQTTRQRLAGRKAAIVYIDVDAYTPASEALAFVADYLQRGTIIVLDDWNCYYADDNLGERKAWREFTTKHGELRFQPFVSTHLAQTFVCLGGASDG